MAIEKMVLLNLVGSLEDEHDLLEELILCENIHLNLDNGDIYDNNYLVHQYEVMMPHEAMPFIENYAKLETEYHQLEEEIKYISQGMGIELNLEKDLLKVCSLEEAITSLSQIKAKVSESIDELSDARQVIHKLEDFRKKVACIKKGALDIKALNKLNFFEYEIGMLSHENKIQIMKNYENITAIVLHIGDLKDVEEDIYLIIYPQQFKEETSRLLKSLNWVPLEIPQEMQDASVDLLEAVTANIQKVETSIQAIEKELSLDQAQMKMKLEAIYTRVKLEQKILGVKEQIIHGNNLFVLNAWIQEKDKQAIEERIANITDKYVVITKDTAEIDKKVIPPTQLKNNWLFKPFEMIVQLYGLPSYYEIDPTPFLALTFMLMFGIMFGDIGQGSVYFLVGMILMKKNAVAGGVLTRLGCSSMVFGLIYGSLFGLEQHQLPWLPSLTGPVLAQENIMRILLVGVAFGITVLSIAYIIGIINALRRKDFEEGLFGKNGVAGYIFFLGFVLTAVSIVGVLPLPVWVPLLIMALMLGVMILKEPLTNQMLGHRPYIHGEVGSYFIESSFEGVETILSALSNGISFIRVGAFALNHAGLFMAFLVMADMTTNTILKMIILLIGNLLILTLEGLVVFILGLRLLYYEMFSKYFKGDGVAYEPLKIEK